MIRPKEEIQLEMHLNRLQSQQNVQIISLPKAKPIAGSAAIRAPSVVAAVQSCDRRRIRGEGGLEFPPHPEEIFGVAWQPCLRCRALRLQHQKEQLTAKKLHCVKWALVQRLDE